MLYNWLICKNKLSSFFYLIFTVNIQDSSSVFLTYKARVYMWWTEDLASCLFLGRVAYWFQALITNRKVSRSSSDRCLARLKDPTSFWGPQWPLGQKLIKCRDQHQVSETLDQSWLWAGCQLQKNTMVNMVFPILPIVEHPNLFPKYLESTKM